MLITGKSCSPFFFSRKISFRFVHIAITFLWKCQSTEMVLWQDFIKVVCFYHFPLYILWCTFPQCTFHWWDNFKAFHGTKIILITSFCFPMNSIIFLWLWKSWQNISIQKWKYGHFIVSSNEMRIIFVLAISSHILFIIYIFLFSRFSILGNSILWFAVLMTCLVFFFSSLFLCKHIYKLDKYA